jgi:hypothetical protein
MNERLEMAIQKQVLNDRMWVSAAAGRLIAAWSSSTAPKVFRILELAALRGSKPFRFSVSTSPYWESVCGEGFRESGLRW